MVIVALPPHINRWFTSVLASVESQRQDMGYQRVRLRHSLGRLG